jgi:spore germination protein KC
MKKVVLIICLLTFIFSSAGCWDYMEYEQMTQIYALGIDLNAESKVVTVTLQFIQITKSTGGKAGETNKGTVFSASGITLMDALTKLQQASPNKLFFGYLQVLVISEDAAKYLINDLIVFFDRTPGIRNSVGIIIVPGKAEGILATTDPNSVTSSGKKIRMLLESSKNNGNTYFVTLHDFLQMMVKEGVEPVAPRILTTAPFDSSGQDSGGTRNDVRFAVQNNGNLLAGGMAVFKKAKFVGWLNDKETMGLNWILGNKIMTYKSSDTDKISANKNMDDLPLYADLDKTSYFYITKSGSKIKIKIENNKPVVYLEVKVVASLRKHYRSKDDYINSDVINTVEQKIERSINSDIMATLDKGHEYNSDIFGFGFNFYRQHPKEWHKYYKDVWDEIFPYIPVEVNVQAKISNTGTNIKKFQIK